MNKSLTSAANLHKNVPPNWYFDSIKRNIGQKYWHNRRFEEVRKVSDKIDGKVLDIGSADGVFSKVILDATNAKELVGIEALQKSVDWANNHWKKEKRLKFKIGNAHKLSFKNEVFDAVYILEVLEHVSDPLVVLKEIKRVLKKGGYVVMLVPTDNKLFSIVWFIWTKFWRGKIWDDCHIQSFKSDSLIDLSKKAGFKLEVNKKFILGMLQIVKVRK